ncbi:MAG: ribose-5-phosphate isomerase [Aeromicrobium sp.]
MRVHIAADHAGFELKTHLIDWLNGNGHDVVDHGAHEFDADDDYPPFCVAASAAAVADPSSLGIVIGGSGNGEQIAANKVKGARAALAWSIETAALARQHNNAQVMAIGARMHTADEAVQIVESFLTTPWSDEARHQRRIDLLLAYEETGRFA